MQEKPAFARGDRVMLIRPLTNLNESVRPPGTKGVVDWVMLPYPGQVPDVLRFAVRFDGDGKGCLLSEKKMAYYFAKAVQIEVESEG